MHAMPAVPFLRFCRCFAHYRLRSCHCRRLPARRFFVAFLSLRTGTPACHLLPCAPFHLCSFALGLPAHAHFVHFVIYLFGFLGFVAFCLFAVFIFAFLNFAFLCIFALFAVFAFCALHVPHTFLHFLPHTHAFYCMGTIFIWGFLEDFDLHVLHTGTLFPSMPSLHLINFSACSLSLLTPSGDHPQ